MVARAFSNSRFGGAELSVTLCLLPYTAVTGTVGETVPGTVWRHQVDSAYSFDFQEVIDPCVNMLPALGSYYLLTVRQRV